VIDPRTTNIVGQRVLILKRDFHLEKREFLGRGVVRVVDYQEGSFALLIEAVGAIAFWGTVSDGSLVTISTGDETYEIVVDREGPAVT
jgi:hypothetical protein